MDIFFSDLEGIVFNLTNADQDFRVQGKATKYLMATDADANDFGVGGSKFGSRFYVSGAMCVVNEQGGDIDFRAEGDTLTHLIFAEANAATENVALLAAGAPDWKGMDRGLFIGDVSSAPVGDPVAGGFLFSEAGALKWRGSAGTVTTLAMA